MMKRIGINMDRDIEKKKKNKCLSKKGIHALMMYSLPSTSSTMAASVGASSSGAQLQPAIQAYPNFVMATLERKPCQLRFLFLKEIMHYDVDNPNRIFFSKEEAGCHMPLLIPGQQLYLNIDDIDGYHVWFFKVKFWAYANVLSLEGTGPYYKAHELKVGDYIIMYKDDENNRFIIQALKENKSINYEFGGQEATQLSASTNEAKVMNIGSSTSNPTKAKNSNYFEIPEIPMLYGVEHMIMDNTPYLYGHLHLASSGLDIIEQSTVESLAPLASFDSFDISLDEMFVSSMDAKKT